MCPNIVGSPVPSAGRFIVTVEVVPPAGPDPERLLSSLEALADLEFDGFSVATNPVAKPRMNALACCSLIQQRTGRPAIVHCTTRDHNLLATQGLLWGARALGVETVLVATGDFVALKERGRLTTVRDVDVFDLVAMAREAGLNTGVVIDPFPAEEKLEREVRRLELKAEAGAQFAVTQPVYDRAAAELLAEAVAHVEIPVVLGVLPLRTSRHAEFLHRKVSGIDVPDELRARMAEAEDPVAAGAENAREMVNLARKSYAGACVMPPFDHFEVMQQILPPAVEERDGDG